MRLLVWHCAPAVAWTALHARLLSPRKGGVWPSMRARWLMWVVGAVAAIAIWLSALCMRGDRPLLPIEYPLSSVISALISALAIVLPVFLLAC